MTYRTVLRERAEDQYGIITTRDAAELGVPAVEMRKLAARGALRRLAYGVYRVPEVATTDLDQFAEAVLRVGPDAFLTADAVLAMHHLGQVNPTKIRVGTARRVRTTLPAYIEVVHQRVPDEDLTVYEGIASTTVARALRDCDGLVMEDRLRAAVSRAKQEGLITRREAASVRITFDRVRRP